VEWPDFLATARLSAVERLASVLVPVEAELHQALFPLGPPAHRLVRPQVAQEQEFPSPDFLQPPPVERPVLIALFPALTPSSVARQIQQQN
jgi:hypothetical protein